MDPISIIIGAVVTILVLFLLSLKGLIYICQPNQVLIFSGTSRMVGARRVGYRLVKGGMGLRKPFIERVDQMDLTNMIIELSAVGAYSKGGVPLNVQGVANVKIAGHEPVLNNAIERFLGKNRVEVMNIAKATLEGSLRGVLATLTPEQVNEDQNMFAEKLVEEVEQDMTALGLVVDTLKVQSITDDVKYLDSIGRIRNSQVLSSARVAEAVARADAMVRSAENNQREVEAQIKAQISVAEADANRRLTDALTRRDAVVAEEQAAVAALVAQASADVQVQKARIDQVRSKLEADVVQPAKAECEALEQKARAEVAPIVEEGKARADALKQLSQSWLAAGEHAREVFLVQKLEPIIRQLTEAIGDTRIDKITIIDSKTSGSFNPARLLALSEQVKEVFGIDLPKKVGELLAEPERPLAPAPAPEPLPEKAVEAPPVAPPVGRMPKR